MNSDINKISIIERFARAGDDGDCGHEKDGGEFAKGNTCAKDDMNSEKEKNKYRKIYIWADDFFDAGGKFEPDGSVWLYHATTREKADQIARTGVLKSPPGSPDDYGVYFASSKYELSNSYGDGTIIKVRVNPRDLNEDDIFPGERVDFMAKTRGNVYRPLEIMKTDNTDRYARAGDADDCGHERKGGEFSRGNTCAGGGRADSREYKQVKAYGIDYEPRDVKARLFHVPAYDQSFWVTDKNTKIPTSRGTLSLPEVYFGPEGDGDEGDQVSNVGVLMEIRKALDSEGKEGAAGTPSWARGKMAIADTSPANFAAFANRQEYEDHCKQAFGKVLEPDEIAGLAGLSEEMKDGDSVRIMKTPSGIYLRAVTSDIKEMIRTFQKDAQGKKYINNKVFETVDKGSGVGLKVFASQVERAIKSKFSYITCEAAGDRANPKYVGYYVWPRMGYDAKLSDDYIHAYEFEISEVIGRDPKERPVRLSDLMKTPAGREFWKNNGHSTIVNFDLSKGSLSRKVLSSYLKERGVDNPEDPDRFRKDTEVGISESVVLEYGPDPVKLAIIERFAKAGDADDCGHNRAGEHKGGKFAKGNTCAAGGSGGDEELLHDERGTLNKGKPSGSKRKRMQMTDEEIADEAEGKGKFFAGMKDFNKKVKKQFEKEAKETGLPKVGKEVVPGGKKPVFRARLENIPERLREYVTDDDLMGIADATELALFVHNFDMALSEVPGGYLPKDSELREMALAGKSTRGQYEWTGNAIRAMFSTNKALGDKMAHTWAALNAILSSQSEYIEHTVGSMELLAMWMDAGMPTQGNKLDNIFIKFKNIKRPPVRKGKVIEDAPKDQWVYKFSTWTKDKQKKAKALFQEVGTKDDVDFRKLISGSGREAGLGKTPEFYSSWFGDGFPMDRHMVELFNFMPPNAGMTVAEVMEKKDKKIASYLYDFGTKAMGRPGVYAAYKALGKKVAKDLGWSLEEVQEAAWSAVIAASTLKAYGMDSEDIVDNIDHAMVHQSWDISSILKREDVQNALKRLGVSADVRKIAEDWKSYSSIKKPPSAGKHAPKNRAAFLDAVRRLPASGPKTRSGKRVILPGKGEVHKFVTNEDIDRFVAGMNGDPMRSAKKLTISRSRLRKNRDRIVREWTEGFRKYLERAMPKEEPKKNEHDGIFS